MFLMFRPRYRNKGAISLHLYHVHALEPPAAVKPKREEQSTKEGGIEELRGLYAFICAENSTI